MSFFQSLLCSLGRFSFPFAPISNRLLVKITGQIGAIVSENPTNPDILLFWACNTLKLLEFLNHRSADLHNAYRAAVGGTLETNLDIALKNIGSCPVTGVALPSVLNTALWTSPAELRMVVTSHFETLDANMSKENLQEVVCYFIFTRCPYVCVLHL